MADEHRNPVEIPNKKTRLRFKEEDDIALLTEVLNLNPFNDPDLWAAVQEHIFLTTKKNFNIKTLKDHLDLLIEAWLTKWKKFKDRSGIELPYSLKDQLLENIYSLMVEFRKPGQKSNKKNINHGGIVSRNEWAKKKFEIKNQPAVQHVLNEENILEIECVSSMEIDIEGTNQDVVAHTEDHTYSLDTSPNKLHNEAGPSGLRRPVEPKKGTSYKKGKTITGKENRTEKEKTEIGKTEENQVHYDSGKYSVLHSVKAIPTVIVPPNIIERRKSRARKSSIQKEGMNYLQAYDKQQNDIRQKEIEIQERKIELEKEKLELERIRLELKRRKLDKEEAENNKKLSILENTVTNLNTFMQNQEKLIYHILTK